VGHLPPPSDDGDGVDPGPSDIDQGPSDTDPGPGSIFLFLFVKTEPSIGESRLTKDM
jgi:hypothetical protein